MTGSMGRGGSPSGFIQSSTQGDLPSIGKGSRDVLDPEDVIEPIDLSQPRPATALASLSQAVKQMCLDDLAKSGLEPKDLVARILSGPERAVCGLPASAVGYVIPYFDSSGDPIAFYRTKIVNAETATQGVKYRQPRRTANHIYFPKRFLPTLHKHMRDHPYDKWIIITEGEKKAACAVKFGIPCVGLGGVDNWRSRTIALPTNSEVYLAEAGSAQDSPVYKPARQKGAQSAADRSLLGGKKGRVTVKLPSSDNSVPELITLAKGFGELLDLIVQHNLKVIICFDSDRTGSVKAEVQRAATLLAYELVYLGIPTISIKQLVLPNTAVSGANVVGSEDEGQKEVKTGLDDYIMAEGPDELVKLIRKVVQDLDAFPKHPNPKGFISSQLSRPMTRKLMQMVASVILTELDAGGQRLRDKYRDIPYYYDRANHHLMPAMMIDRHGRPLHESPFGTLLYRRYGLSANDDRLLVWLAAQYTGEEPITDVVPRRVIALITEEEDALNPNGLAYQASDSQYFAISGDPKRPIELLTNGSKGILFEQNQVEPLDVDLVLENFEHQLQECQDNKGKIHSWWREVIEETNLGMIVDEGAYKLHADGSIDTRGVFRLTTEGIMMREYATILFYISPWLSRWRGMQLPVEMTVGGAGSGKSSLYSLRLDIQTGRPKLRNIPKDIRDWTASLANSGGMVVTDNVHFTSAELKQRLSDEICRLITEPDPHVEMRRLYTDTDLLVVPINTTFAFTSIRPPFSNEDLIQRSITFRTIRTDRKPDGDWVKKKLEERGGREAWIAHHLFFLHKLIAHPWNPDFQTDHRLAHLEQTMKIAAHLLGVTPQSIMAQAQEQQPEATTSSSTAPPIQAEQVSRRFQSVLADNQRGAIVENDWTLQGLKAFADEHRQPGKHYEFACSEVEDWAASQEEYEDNDVLSNSRKLGRYISLNISTVMEITGITPYRNYGNSNRYIIPAAPREAKQ